MALHNQPENLNILSPVSFRLIIQKFPNVNFWCQSVNIPDMTISEITVPTPFVDIPIIGDRIEFGDLIVTILVDEDLINFLEITKTKPQNVLENQNSKTFCSFGDFGFKKNKKTYFGFCWSFLATEV